MGTQKGYVKVSTYLTLKGANKRASLIRDKGIPVKVVKGRARVKEGRVSKERTVYRVWAKPIAQKRRFL